MKITIPEIKVEFEGRGYGGELYDVSVRLDNGRIRPTVIVPKGVDPLGSVVDMIGEDMLSYDSRQQLTKVRREFGSIIKLTQTQT